LQIRAPQAQPRLQQPDRFGRGRRNLPCDPECLVEDGPRGDAALDEPKAFRLASGNRQVRHHQERRAVRADLSRKQIRKSHAGIEVESGGDNLQIERFVSQSDKDLLVNWPRDYVRGFSSRPNVSSALS
jgi:hypothetical protein